MKHLSLLLAILFGLSAIATEEERTLRATPIREPRRPMQLYSVEIPHTRTPQRFKLSVPQRPTALFCIPNGNTAGVWDCFDNCTGNGPGGTWGNCEYIGFCVEGYNNNSSICHF